MKLTGGIGGWGGERLGGVHGSLVGYVTSKKSTAIIPWSALLISYSKVLHRVGWYLGDSLQSSIQAMYDEPLRAFSLAR